MPYLGPPPNAAVAERANETDRCLACLEPSETNPNRSLHGSISVDVSPGIGFHARSKAVRVLGRSVEVVHRKQANKIAACCMGAYISERSDGTLALVPSMCRNRMCPACTRARSLRVFKQVLALTQPLKQVRMLTLTLKASTDPLATMLDRLISAYRNLRNIPEWKRSVRGAVAIVETTRGHAGDSWHVHLHILWEGEYLPHPVVKAAWHRITGDSYIVHMNCMGSGKQAARYVSKYVGKSSEVYEWRDAEVWEYATAMRGRRLLITSGTWHGAVKKQAPSDSAADTCTTIVTLGELMHAHADGVHAATECLHLIGQLGGLVSGLSPLARTNDPPTREVDKNALRAAILDTARETRSAIQRIDERIELHAAGR